MSEPTPVPEIRVYPEHEGRDNEVVCDYGEHVVIFDGSGYFGTFLPSEFDFSAVTTLEEAQQWCLDRMTNPPNPESSL
jgi:hypothetical protein